MWVIMCWALGTWAPALQHVIFNPMGMLYIFVTGTAGMVVAFHTEVQENNAIETNTRVTLQVLGPVIVYLSLADHHLALVAVGLLVWYKLGWPIIR